MLRRLRRVLTPLLCVLVVLALIGGIWAGGHPDVLPQFARDALVDDTEAQVFDEALDTIAGDFFRQVDRDELLDSALEGAVRSLEDRFSHYIDPQAYQEFEESTNGEFEGVGLNVEEIPQGLRVLTVFEDGPAAKAGVRRGDRIVAVDGRSLEGRSSEESTGLIKGPAGTSVRLTLVRGGQRRQVTVERDQVSVPVSRSRMIEHDGEKVGYVALAQFTSGAHGAVGERVRDLLDRGADRLILDLRENGGGLLQEGVLVASVFIPEGTIVTTRGRNRAARTFSASGDAIDTDVPLVVLVNRGTASASEIVAGALQDRDRAEVVGTRTFGKGVFQEIVGLGNGGALDITVGQYFTPEGRNLGPRNGEPGGIAPDVRAEDDPETRPDEALERALDVLTR